MHQVRRVAGLLVAAVLALSLIGTSLPRAHAAPKPTPQSSAPDPWIKRPEPSDTVKNYVKRVKATVNALGAGTKVLDYRKAKQKFGSHVKWRRSFAAGWMAYHSVSHMSKAERRKVVAIAKRYHTARHTTASEATPMNGCTGTSATLDHKLSGRATGYEVWSYYNSCQTSAMIRGYTNQVSIMCGVLGAVTVAAISPAGPIAGLAGAIVASACLEAVHARVADIENAQDWSSKHAVIIETRSPSKWVGYYKVEPQ